MPLTIGLAVGSDPALLGTRSLVLHSAGFTVVFAPSLKEAVDHFHVGDFDLVILCRSIPAKDRECLTSLIRASGSYIPVVSIAETAGQHDAFANATLDASDTNMFIRDLREALRKALLSFSVNE
jgi:DNA-binding response OmpR family regulator